MSQQESAPLLGNGGENSNYYFLKNDNQNGSQADNGSAFVEEIPKGSNANEFEPRMLGARPKPQSILGELQPEGEKGLFGILFGTKKKDAIHDHSIPALKQRKAPIKVEPKVFFANERTFLAWMHISIILAGSSIAILAFSDENTNTSSQVYGIIMLPVAVAFIVYAMYQYVRRAYMIRNKHPGPYDDTVGPTVLGILLMLSIVCQFAIKLYSMSL